MGLMDKAVRALALRWLSGKVRGLRQGGSSMMKLLDGNRRLIVVFFFVLSGLISGTTGQDVTQWLDLLLRALGWSDAALAEYGKAVAMEIVPRLFAVWALWCAAKKMWAQRKAGATLQEVNSNVGYAKAALAEGVIRVSDNGPVIVKG